MTVLEQGRPRDIAIIGNVRCATVQWNEPLDAVLARMDALAGDEASVMQGSHRIGRITRARIEQLRCQGNWTACIAAVDAMEREAA